MTTATTDAPAPPWAPNLDVVRKALSLRTNRVALTRIEKNADGREWGNAHAFLLPSELDEAVEWVRRSAGPNITLTWTAGYLTPEGAERINTSAAQTVARGADMAGFQWVPVDLDPREDTPLSVYLNKLTEYGITPTLLNDSGRGLHAYWQLPEAVPHEQARQTLVDLVRYFDSDPGTVEPNRNLRLPGTWNGKPQVCRLAVVKRLDLEARYDLDTLSNRACALSPRPTPPPKKAPRPIAAGDDWRERFRADLDLADELTRLSRMTPVGRGGSRKWLCPCGEHEGTVPQVVVHRNNDQRAVCFGTSHPEGMGRKSDDGTRTTFDVIDLRAWEEGKSAEDYMREQRAQHKAAGTPPHQRTAEQSEQTSEQAQSEPTEQGPWPLPRPLTKEPDSIPIDQLPPVVRDLVAATVETHQTPPEIPLTFALTALSAATRGCWEVVVAPWWNAGPTSLYGITLAESGERKSGGSRPLLVALREAEKRLAVQVRAENRDRELRRKAAEARMKKVPEDEDGCLREQAIIHENRPRPVPELELTDATTEALGMVMEAQGGAAALFPTEATAFRTVAGAYNDKGRGGNVGLLNHAYDGDPYRDKRVNRGGVSIPRPILAWGAAVQTSVLTGYADGTTEGSGFLARFLLLLPTSLVGQRRVRTEPIPPAVQQAWDTALTALHGRAWDHYKEMSDDPDDFGAPLTITCDTEAADLLLDYAQALEDRKLSDTELRALGGWIEKHPARLGRIAALFALLENPYATTITATHMRAAMSMAPALVEHATATLRVLRNTGDTGPVRRILDALSSLRQPVVSTRDVYQKVRDQAWVDDTESVRDVLHELAEDDYLRGPVKKVGPKGGKPSEQWHLNPREWPWAAEPPDDPGGEQAETSAEGAGL